MLFKLTDTLYDYAELTTVNFSAVRPTIRLVEQQHILPLLGNALYDLLNNAYTAATLESDLDARFIQLLEKCRCVIGPMLCYYFTPKAEVQLSGAGAQRTESASNKTAYQNQVVNFREQNLREGEMAIELLLQFLDTNKADYPEWAASEGFADYSKYFIKSAKEFDGLFSTHSPYRNYMAMRPKMYDVEENAIRKLLGDPLFDHLKGSVLTAADLILLQKVKKVIAYQTVATAIPFLNIRMDANGITVMNQNAAQNDQLAKRVSADKVMLNSIIESCRAGAESWMANVSDYIVANVTEFEDYLPTITVEVVPAPVVVRCLNEDSRGSFGMI